MIRYLKRRRLLKFAELELAKIFRQYILHHQAPQGNAGVEPFKRPNPARNVRLQSKEDLKWKNPGLKLGNSPDLSLC